MVIGCLQVSDVSVICRVVNPNRTCPKIWEYVLCTDCTGQRNDFELIPTAKIETLNPTEGYFGGELPPSVIIAELWQPDVARRKNFVRIFCVFLEKNDILQ